MSCDGTLLRPTPRCAAAMLAASLLAMPAAPLARRSPLSPRLSPRWSSATNEDVAMRCSAQSDAGSAANPEWEAVLAQLLAEEAEEEELCCRFERRGDDSDDGWDNYSEEEEDAAVQGVAGKVDESLEERDERACATGGGFST